MSKGNMLLGYARGKVGDLVFSRANGKQIVRAKADVVKNPKTEAQMIQRIILNTVAQAYSKMQAITDHSFEGVQQGQKTMSKFMTENMKMLRQKIAAANAANGNGYDVYAFTPVGQNVLVDNEYIVSRGSLPQVDCSITEVSSGNYGVLVPLSTNTYQGFIDEYGLQRGDQITICTVDNSAGRPLFNYARIILDPRNADGTAADLSSTLIADGAVNLPNPRNEGKYQTIAFTSGTGLTLQTQLSGTTMACVIVSRQSSDGNWLRSNANMVVGGLTDSEFFTLEYALEESAEAFSTESSVYLNNAGAARTLASAASEANHAYTLAEAENALVNGGNVYTDEGVDNLAIVSNWYSDTFTLTAIMGITPNPTSVELADDAPEGVTAEIVNGRLKLSAADSVRTGSEIAVKFTLNGAQSWTWVINII